jgi:hypothetical protein
MIHRVLSISSGKAWNKVAEEILQNIQDIVYHECAPVWLSDVETAAAAADLGELGGLKWQFFVLRIIAHIKRNGRFGSEKKGFDIFDDYGEAVWCAGSHFLLMYKKDTWDPSHVCSEDWTW